MESGWMQWLFNECLLASLEQEGGCRKDDRGRRWVRCAGRWV